MDLGTQALQEEWVAPLREKPRPLRIDGKWWTPNAGVRLRRRKSSALGKHPGEGASLVRRGLTSRSRTLNEMRVAARRCEGDLRFGQERLAVPDSRMLDGQWSLSGPLVSALREARDQERSRRLESSSKAPGGVADLT